MRTHTINNERGIAALLSVIVLSMIMVSTLSSFYIYLENRARYQERLRMNYQTGYVMEDMGRAISTAYEQGLQVVSGAVAACPDNTDIAWLDCKRVCAAKTATLDGTVPAGTPSLAVCVRNDTLNKIVNGADYFCAFNPDGGSGPPSYCSGLAKNEDIKNDGAVIVASTEISQDSKIEQWYGRLDNFFDTTIVKGAPQFANQVLETEIQPPTVFGWLLPETAYAGTNPGGNVDCNANPSAAGCSDQCSGSQKPAFCKNIDSSVSITRIADGCGPTSTDVRCKKCGKDQRFEGAADSGTCMKVSICPPWISSHECLGSQTDKRIQQMVRVD